MKYILVWAWVTVGCLPASHLFADSTNEWVLEHPFKRSSASGVQLLGTPSGRGLTEDAESALNFADRSQHMMENLHLNPRIRLLPQAQKSFSLYTKDRIQTVQYGFAIDGFPLCDYEVKVHETLSGAVSAMGRVPRFENVKDFVESDWPSESDLRQLIQETLVVKGLGPDFRLDQKRRCLWNNKGDLEPVFEVDVAADPLRYSLVLSASEVYRFEPKYFHATAQISVFPNNENDSERQTFEIASMKGDGTLENSSFIGCIPSNSPSPGCPTYEGNTRIAYEQVREASGTYSYDPTAEYSKFAQTSVFVNANRALSWLQDMGYSNFGSIPIRLAVHAAFSKDTNNALYEPRDTYSMIYVGDGDNSVLQNLATDSDVVSHELGHHVIYHSIKRIEGESLVLHEGIADFLTFARTGNACLGESICPDTSLGAKICAVPKRCLRTGDNEYSLTGADLPKEAHQKSQFVSGMLWDLSKKDGLPMQTVASIVLKSIDLMVTSSGYQHFVIGLLLADNANNGGQNCETIRARAAARGMGSYLADVTCEQIKAQPLDRSVDTFGSMAPAASKETRKGATRCGVLGGSSSGQGSMQLVIWMLPLVIVGFRRLKK